MIRRSSALEYPEVGHNRAVLAVFVGVVHECSRLGVFFFFFLKGKKVSQWVRGDREIFSIREFVSKTGPVRIGIF